MKKTSINLLTNKQDYYGLEKKFGLVRKITLGYCIVVFAAGLTFAYAYSQEQISLKNLYSQKQALLSQIAMYKNDEAKMSLFAKKLEYFDTFSREDARFSPYYNLLVSTLKTSSSSAQLSQFKITKDRSVDFNLTFDTLAEALTVFGDVESEQFTKHFETLVLNTFTGSDQESTKYELQFKGVFKKINAEL